MPRLAPLLSTALISLCVPLIAAAQEPASDAPAHIAVVDGAALLERDGRSESAPSSMPLLAGDRVRTQNGRVEILYADGSTLHLDAHSLVDFQSDEVIRLLEGRIRLNIAGPRRQVDYRVDAPSGWVQIPTPGEYRISVIPGERDAEVELAVLRGSADLVNEEGRTSLAAGERAFARAGAGPSSPYVYNSANWDAFDRWSEARRDTRLGVSAEYLPENVRSYSSTFNSYGYWQNEPTYGYVWYPRVAPGWRPYYFGRWTTLRPWGWTWIGTDPWAWPTHHYGRWGFNGGNWFWIPGRTWGAAWVSWAYAPGYVSWCPLGWDNRAVFAFNFVNVHRGFRHNPWHGWTVVPHGRFGSGFVNVNVINSTRIDVRTRNSFVVRDASPNFRGYAVPRSSAPIRVAGSRIPGGSVDGNSAAFSRSRGVATPGGTANNTDPTAAFRSRRSNGASLNGPGYPAPAREPRSMSTVPSPSRQAVPRTREQGAGGSDVRSPAERRAVPRGSVSPDSVGSPSRTPSYRGPEYRAPVSRAPSYEAPSSSERRIETYRAIPRENRGDNPAYAPSPSYGAPRERSNPYRSPSDGAPDAPRAVPRSAPPDSGGGSPGYRSRPGPERSAPAPSGPPPSSAEPSRPSGGSPPSRSNGDGGGSRSRGGSVSGRAVPRGGRG
jgi:FecR protein